MATCKKCGGDSFVDMTALQGDVVSICTCCGRRDDSIDEPREPPMSRLTTWNEALQRVREAKAALALDLAEKARLKGSNPKLIEYLEARATVASMEAEHGAGLSEKSPKEQPMETAEMALARETAALCADLFMLAGTCISAPLPELMVIAKGNQVQIGLCGAAVALRELLKRDELGSVALRDLVHKPGFHDVQGK